MYIVAFLHKDLLGKRNEVLLLFAHTSPKDKLTVTTFDMAHDYLTINLSYDSLIRGVTSLQQLGYARQTAGNIRCRAHGTRNLHEQHTRLDLLTICQLQVSAYR